MAKRDYVKEIIGYRVAYRWMERKTRDDMVTAATL
jgi:hypothetical protein